MTDAAILDRTETPTTRQRVTGMDCASCAAKVEAAVRRLPDVTQVQVSVATETLAVRHGPGSDATAIAATVGRLGYGAEDPDATVPEEADEIPWWQAPKAPLAFACGAALVAAYALGNVAPTTERWAFLAAMAVGLVPVARRAASAARHGTPFSIEMLMTIAALGATVIGATEDEPRSDAKAGIARLARDGIGAVMLTGDNAATARAVAGALGIEARADLLPEDKQRIVREFQATGAV